MVTVKRSVLDKIRASCPVSLEAIRYDVNLQQTEFKGVSSELNSEIETALNELLHEGTICIIFTNGAVSFST